MLVALTFSVEGGFKMVSRIQNANVDLAKIKATYFEAQRKGDANGMRAAKQQAMAAKQNSNDTMQIPEDSISISQQAKDSFDSLIKKSQN